MATQESTIALKIAGTLTNALDLSAVVDRLAIDLTTNFSHGTGARQANTWFHDRRTLSASANESLDLAGSRADAFGATKTFTKVKALLVRADPGNTNNVQVTRPGSNGVPIFMAAGDGIALTPGAFMLLVFTDANGVAVTASTGDLINFANSAGSTSVTYEIWILATE
jgi:hypothetical protein